MDGQAGYTPRVGTARALARAGGLYGSLRTRMSRWHTRTIEGERHAERVLNLRRVHTRSQNSNVTNTVDVRDADVG